MSKWKKQGQNDVYSMLYFVHSYEYEVMCVLYFQKEVVETNH